MKFLGNNKVEDMAHEVESVEKYLEELQLYLVENPPFMPEVFDEMSEVAFKFSNERLKDQIKVQTSLLLYNFTY